MLSQEMLIPETLKRYPRVDAGERDTLERWVASLSTRHLVMLLAIPELEAKLVSIKRDELAVEPEPLQAKPEMIVGALALGSIALGIAAMVFHLT